MLWPGWFRDQAASLFSPLEELVLLPRCCRQRSEARACASTRDKGGKGFCKSTFCVVTILGCGTGADRFVVMARSIAEGRSGVNAGLPRAQAPRHLRAAFGADFFHGSLKITPVPAWLVWPPPAGRAFPEKPAR